ncbi:hypothetical protein [uncultured Sphingomonas sp.]|uniref:hypothetical protein n=1 Tax=uncultured Sphingomonas sp. TaxID=158754 RepID=UPI0025F9A07F|nr:hypothetical protein [uncultured Sphingomonas sp.]
MSEDDYTHRYPTYQLDDDLPEEIFNLGEEERRRMKVEWESNRYLRTKKAVELIIGVATSQNAFDEALNEAMHFLPRSRSAPPSTLMLDLLMKPDEALDAAANLEDYHPMWVAKYGPKRAGRIFRIQMGRIIIGYWWGRLVTQVERVAKTVSLFVRPGGS